MIFKIWMLIADIRELREMHERDQESEDDNVEIVIENLVANHPPPLCIWYLNLGSHLLTRLMIQGDPKRSGR